MRGSLLLCTLLSFTAEAEAAPPKLPGVRQIVAHRGSSADSPENTLAAVRRAIDAGATAIEVDVRTTKDGHLVALHDATLDRTTDGTGAVNDLTLAEVKKLDAGGWFDAKFRGEKVPTLKEVLALCGNRADVLLDLKESGDAFAKSVAGVVNEHGRPARTIVGVRSVAQAKLIRELLPKSRQLGLIPRPNDIAAFAEAGVETIRLWPDWLKDDPALVRKVREAKARLHLNGKTGEPDEVVPLLKHRPDSLSSDDPARLVRTLAAP